MRISLLAAIAALAARTAAVPASTAHVLHERRELLHPTWTKRSPADGSVVVPVRIGMTQSNLDRGHDLLMEVSQHDSPKYGKHYTEEEIIEIFAPSAETIDAIRAWLESAGITKDRVTQSFNKQWLQFDSAIEEIETLLKTKYHVYKHANGEDHVACDEYHVPGHIRHHIDYITPGIKLMPSTGSGKAKTKRDVERYRNHGFKQPPLFKDMPTRIEEVTANTNTGNLALCDSVMSPACIRALYNITKAGGVSGGKVLGIFEDLGDHYSQKDLDLFFKAVVPHIPQGTHPELNAIDGATGPIDVLEAGPESDLDFQISYPIIYPSKSVLFQTDDDPTSNDYTYSGFLNNFFDGIDGSYCTDHAFGAKVPSPLDPPYPDPKAGGYKGKLQCGKYNPTDVISISYGGVEVGLPGPYQKRQCSEIMKLGMRGISVVVSSGDFGVGYRDGEISPNGCLPASATQNGTIFVPAFPATCPYITVIGASFLPPGADVNKDEEVAVTRFPSGGGFSNIYPVPSYQSSAVASYLKNHRPPYPSYKAHNNKQIPLSGNNGIYNSIGRGYPDFAAVGDNVLIYNRGSPRLIGGTSASAPAFASILARINLERKKKNKGTVGFVNPVLYANPHALRDVVKGSNPACGTNGFSAAPGWDPVTGLGTPDFPKLLDLFMLLD